MLYNVIAVNVCAICGCCVLAAVNINGSSHMYTPVHVCIQSRQSPGHMRARARADIACQVLAIVSIIVLLQLHANISQIYNHNYDLLWFQLESSIHKETYRHPYCLNDEVFILFSSLFFFLFWSLKRKIVVIRMPKRMLQVTFNRSTIGTIINWILNESVLYWRFTSTMC